MKHISESLALIINLSNASKFHKEHCMIEDCGVSLLQLRKAARLIANSVPIEEYSEAVSIVGEMSIT